MARSPISTTFAVLLGLASPLLAAQGAATSAETNAPVTQLGAHLHGKVVVNLAVEADTLSAELDAPAINVLGFERAPRSAAEKDAAAAIDRWLASGAGVLGVPAAAGCTRSRVDYPPPRFGGEDHDHDHEHDHDAEDDGGEHADYVARYTYTCSNPAALGWVELWLVRRLRNVAEIEVNLVTAQRQTPLTLGAAAGRVELR